LSAASGSWNTHGDAAAANPGKGVLAHREHFFSTHFDAAGGLRAGRQQTQQRERDRGLAAAGFSDQA